MKHNETTTQTEKKMENQIMREVAKLAAKKFSGKSLTYEQINLWVIQNWDDLAEIMVEVQLKGGC